MKRIEIAITDDIFASKAEADIISTGIYVDMQGVCFPDDQWTDLTNRVLGTWEYMLLSKRDQKFRKFSLYFMDGPYRIDVVKGQDGQITLECINCKYHDRLIHTFTCQYSDLLIALTDAYKKFSYLLYRNQLCKGEFEPVYRQTLAGLKNLKKALSEDDK